MQPERDLNYEKEHTVDSRHEEGQTLVGKTIHLDEGDEEEGERYMENRCMEHMQHKVEGVPVNHGWRCVNVFAWVFCLIGEREGERNKMKILILIECIRAAYESRAGQTQWLRRNTARSQ